MARESGAVGSECPVPGLSQREHCQVCRRPTATSELVGGALQPPLQLLPLPSALSLPCVSPALGSAPRLIKQPQMLKTQCLFYFIFLHTCITPQQTTPGIGLFVWFYFVAFRGKKGREKRRNNTNHPALEAVSGQAAGSGFLPEVKSVGVGVCVWVGGRQCSLLGSGMSEKGKQATWVRGDKELEPCDNSG